MKKLKRLSLTDEINRDAKQVEEEIKSRKDLDDLQVSESMEASLFNKIQEYEFDKRQKTVYRRKKKKYIFLALAAVLILVCGSVMTGVGSKSYLKELWDRITGNENIAYIDVEDMESRDTEDLDEMGIYKEINQTFGIGAVRLGYKPKLMSLDRYTIDVEQRKAFMLYVYNGEVIRYSIYINDSDSSMGQKELDKLTDKYQVETSNGIIVQLEEYELDNSKKRYIGEFEYQGVHYQLMGSIEKEEFEKILKDLKFL